MNEKIIIINQLLTDLIMLDKEGQEKEITLIINKVAKLKKIEEEEMAKAEKAWAEEQAWAEKHKIKEEEKRS